MMASWWIPLARSTANMWVPPIIQHRHHFTAKSGQGVNILNHKYRLHFATCIKLQSRSEYFHWWTELMRHFARSSRGTRLSVCLAACLSVCLTAPCVQLPVGAAGRNRWRCNGKSLSPLAALAFPRRGDSRQPRLSALRVCSTAYNCDPPGCPARYISRMETWAEKNCFIISKCKAFLDLFLCVVCFLWPCQSCGKKKKWKEKKKRVNQLCCRESVRIFMSHPQTCPCLHKNKLITTGRVFCLDPNVGETTQSNQAVRSIIMGIIYSLII